MKAATIIGVTFLVQFALINSACSASLPDGYTLEKNSAGEMYLKNPQGMIVVYPKILSYGYNEEHFVACIKDEILNAELKRYSFVNLKNGNAVATTNLKQWNYFLKEIPSLGKVKLNQVGEEQCP